MIRWEYKKVSLSGSDNELDDRYLNSLGLEGWEAVSIIAATHPPQAGNHNTISVLLKREVGIEPSAEEVEAAVTVLRETFGNEWNLRKATVRAALRAARLASLGR